MAAVKHVVVDSGGFIRNAPLKDIGENIYTLREVIGEIRDKATRQRLQVLPYDLKFKDPAPEAIRTVTEFAKKTGDYKSLSAVDIRVIALVYHLEKEHVGTQHLKGTPDRNVSWQTAKKPLQNPTEIAGFYLNKGGKVNNLESERKSNSEDAPITEGVSELQVTETEGDISDTSTTLEATQREIIVTSEENLNEIHTERADTSKECELSKVSNDKNDSGKSLDLTVSSESQGKARENVRGDLTKRTPMDGDAVTKEMVEGGGDSEKTVGAVEGDILPGEYLEGGSSEENEVDSCSEEEEEEDDDGGGWITPSNIKQVKASMGDVHTQRAEVVVGCMTTDFAMQNVLLQMGLNVVSVDGMLIKRAKTYVLRCFSCFKISTDMTRDFCSHCGNQTLQKVAMTVEEDGKIKYFLSTRKALTTRGLKYSLPTPKGGKHAINPVLVEDQKEAQQRGTKNSKVKYNPFDPDYVAHTSPFAPTDIYSRAAQLGIRGQRGQKQTRNPNENNKIYGRRK